MATSVGESTNGSRPAPELGSAPQPSVHPMPLHYWNEHRYDLNTPLDVLRQRIRVLLDREKNLDEAGVTCALKDQPDMTCSACPVCEVGQDTRKSALCRLGREQERIIALALAQKDRDGDG